LKKILHASKGRPEKEEGEGEGLIPAVETPGAHPANEHAVSLLLAKEHAVIPVGDIAKGLLHHAGILLVVKIPVIVVGMQAAAMTLAMVAVVVLGMLVGAMTLVIAMILVIVVDIDVETQY
jgi:hypothetical protein